MNASSSDVGDSPSVAAALRYVDDLLSDIPAFPAQHIEEHRLGELVTALGRVAGAYLDEGARDRALGWARCALHFAPHDDRAQFMEARAIIAIDKHTTSDKPQRLGLAIARLQSVAESGVQPFCDQASKLLSSNLVDPGRGGSVRDKFQQRLAAFVKDEAVAVERKGGSPIKQMKGLTLSGLGLDGNDNDISVNDAMAMLRAGKGRGPHNNKAKRLEHFLTLVDETPVETSAAQLEQYAAFRQCNSRLSVVSWNAKLLNTIDQRDHDFVDAAREKACNIGERAAAPDVLADLVCIQEAPGPQLLTRGGEGAKRAVSESVLPHSLQKSLQECSAHSACGERDFQLASVDVACLDEHGQDQGEQHVFCFDAAALQLQGQPRPLAECADDQSRGRRFHRAPALVEFLVAKEGRLHGAWLLVASVHLKSGGKEATVEEVALVARALAEYTAACRRSERTVLLLLGDFNLSTARVIEVLRDNGIAMKPCFDDGPTNMWRFTGRGALDDGEQYDAVLLWEWQPPAEGADDLAAATDGHVVTSGRVLAIPELEAAYHEMLRVAQALDQPPSRIGERALGGFGAAEAERVARATRAERETPATDGVPGWLRQSYRKQVAKVWSDHMPITAQLA